MTTGSVFGEALRVFGRRWYRYLTLYAVAVVPSVVVRSWLPGPWDSIMDPILLVLFPLANGAIAFAVLTRSGDYGLALSAYARIAPRGLHLVAADFVSILGIAMGLVALVVPGLAAAWSVFTPVLVAERDVGLGLRRSLDLTDGRTWIGFWVVVLPVLIVFAVSIPIWLLGLNDEVPYVIGRLVIDLVLSAYAAVAAAVFYRRLIDAHGQLTLTAS
jgi:hypothetical protein